MISNKEREEKLTPSEKPRSRFYVCRWHETKDEMSEIRDYVRAHKNQNSCKDNLISKTKAGEIREKIVR